MMLTAYIYYIIITNAPHSYLLMKAVSVPGSPGDCLHPDLHPLLVGCEWSAPNTHTKSWEVSLPLAAILQDYCITLLANSDITCKNVVASAPLFPTVPVCSPGHPPPRCSMLGPELVLCTLWFWKNKEMMVVPHHLSWVKKHWHHWGKFVIILLFLKNFGT